MLGICLTYQSGSHEEDNTGPFVLAVRKNSWQTRERNIHSLGPFGTCRRKRWNRFCSETGPTYQRNAKRSCVTNATYTCALHFSPDIACRPPETSRRAPLLLFLLYEYERFKIAYVYVTVIMRREPHPREFPPLKRMACPPELTTAILAAN